MKSISKTNVIMVLLLMLTAVALIACKGNELSVGTMPPDETLNATSSATAVPIEVLAESVTLEPNLSQPAPEEEPIVESPSHESAMQPILTLTDYPPCETPYHIENGDLWLIHTPEGQLYAFAPIAPTYAGHINVDECRYTWSEPQHRFVDPCSGDEWELNGALNLEHSTELWSNRDLDQYGLSLQEGKIFVQLNNIVAGLPIDQPPLAQDSQYGLTVTAVSTNFTPQTTILDTLIQVDPIWQMNPVAFPPQQALSYPDLLFDDQGGSIAAVGREGSTAVYNPSSGGLQQMMSNRWGAISPEATMVTATLTIDLSNLYREIILQPDWSSHQEGDRWAVDIPLEIGHAAATISEIAWQETLNDGRVRLRLTVNDNSPDDIRLYCLHVDTADPLQSICANFDSEQTYTVLAQPGEPVALHLRAGVQLLTPFQLILDEIIPNVAAELPAQPETNDEWQRYTGSALNLSFDYPVGWYVHEAGKALQITPNSQPTWSSFADPEQSNDGPYFDLLYNLNRQMGATPLAEAENIVSSYTEEVVAVETAAPVDGREDVVVGVYRFAEAEDDMVWLVGAVTNPIEGSLQAVIAQTAVVKRDELTLMQPIFEAILRSIGSTDTRSSSGS